MSAPRPRHATRTPPRLAKFDAGAAGFWDPHGEFRPLHLLNPLRARFIAEQRRLPLAAAACLMSAAAAASSPRVWPRRGAGERHRPGPGHDRGRAPACRPRGARIDYRVAGPSRCGRERRQPLMPSPAWRCSSTCPPGRHRGATCRLAEPRRRLFVSTLNRNLKSFLMASSAPNTCCRLIPRGTHEYERFIRPAELARWARAAGLTLAPPPASSSTPSPSA